MESRPPGMPMTLYYGELMSKQLRKGPQPGIARNLCSNDIHTHRQNITGIAPLKQRRDSNTLIMYTKENAMKYHPMNERTDTRGKGRLKGTATL